MIKVGSDIGLGCVWRLCNMIFESGVPEYWRSAVIVPLCMGKGEKT